MSDDEEIDFSEYWPRSGDRLFVPGNPGRDAEIAGQAGERMYRMKVAFKNTADLLVSHTEENVHERSNLVWPIVFCYRQYIELTLKDIIARHGHGVEPPIEPIWTMHELGTLWKHCRSIMDAILVEITIDEMPEIRAMTSIIIEFERVDAGSYAFRFPTDTKGRQIEIPIDSIDLVHLRGVMEGVFTFLDASESALGLHFEGLP